MNRLQVLRCDITKIDVDVIVNAANEWMVYPQFSGVAMFESSCP